MNHRLNSGVKTCAPAVMRPPETVEEQFHDDLVDSKIIFLLRIILLNSCPGAVAVLEVSCTLVTLQLFDNYKLINWTYY